MRHKLLIICIVAPLAIGAVMASVSFKARVAQDCGGGAALSSGFKTRGSIGGAVCGPAQSTAFISYAGPLPRTQHTGAIVVVENITRAALTTGEECFVYWHATVDGDFTIEVGGTGTPGSGLVVDSGSCLADASIESRIHELSLTDDDRSIIYIYVDDGSDTYYAAVVLTDDQTPPDATFTQVTVEGSVDDASVTDVYVNTVSVPVASGQYQAVVSTGLSEIIIEATNDKSQTMTRKVRTW